MFAFLALKRPSIDVPSEAGRVELQVHPEVLLDLAWLYMESETVRWAGRTVERYRRVLLLPVPIPAGLLVVAREEQKVRLAP